MTCPFYNHGICLHHALERDRHVDDLVCNFCTLVENKKASCNHKGSARSCCKDLNICRKLKKDCVENLVTYTQYKSETKHPELFEERIVCCETCEHNTTLQSPSQEP